MCFGRLSPTNSNACSTLDSFWPMNSKVLIVALLVGFTLACDTRPLTEFPEFPDGGIVKDARPIPPESLQKIDGLLASREPWVLAFPVVMHGTRFGVSLFGDVNSLPTPVWMLVVLDGRLIHGGRDSRQATNTTTGSHPVRACCPRNWLRPSATARTSSSKPMKMCVSLGKFGEESSRPAR